MSKYCNHCMAKLETAGGKCPVCGKENTSVIPAHHLLPETILNGKFYVGEALGEGGFGITYIGRDIKLDMKVAIKEFYPNGYVNRNNTFSPQVNDSATEGRKNFFEKGRERFLKEAQILARFSGEPGVVDVRDFFEENNTAYIIMEFLDGVDLKTYLKKHGTLTPEHTIQLLMPVMNSLKKVHAQGLIHRDISPDNIMIVGDKVKLLDFGAARTVSAAANKSLSVILKPGYAPEEQYRSKGNQGPWTDIYALCATMYKCITGITPDDAAQRVFSDEVKTPSALNITIKPEIERAIMRGMSVHQTDRYQCIEDLIRSLQGIEVAICGTAQTVAAVKNVSDDMETVCAANDKKDLTVIDDMIAFAPVEEQRIAENVNADRSENDSAVIENVHTSNDKLKGFIVAAIAIIALIVVLLFTWGGDAEKPAGDENSSVSTQAPDSNISENNSNADVEITVPNEADNAEKPADDESSSASTQAPDSDISENNVNENVEIVISDDLYDFTFELEGVVYTLPCEYDDFTGNGWTISGTGYSGDLKIAGNSYDCFRMSNDGRNITVYSYNMSGDAKPVKDCKIGGIECESYNGVNFVIAKGITLQSSVKDIKNAFGVPGYSNSGSDYETITYYAQKDSYHNSVKFYCNADGKCSCINMKNFIETEDDKTTTSTDRPTYLYEYKVPTAMGKDLKSAVVEIEGDLYQIPAPVSEFIDNGWEITQQSGDVAAGGRDSICVQKNGKKLDLYIVNYSEYQTTVENCAVYKVYADEYGNYARIFVGSEANAITIGTPKAGVDSMVSDDFDYYEGSYIYSYLYSEYRERDFSVSINVNKDTDKVVSVSVCCKTWEY